MNCLDGKIEFSFFISSFAMSNNDAKSLLREAIRDLNKEKLLQLLHVDLEPCDLSQVSFTAFKL